MTLEWSDGQVYRQRPLPRGELRGRFHVSTEVIRRTRESLERFADLGRTEGGHEGLVFWAGEEKAHFTTYSGIVVPDATHSPLGVFVDEVAYGRAVREARNQDLLLLAQVHSHPGNDVRHSDGDDDLIVMPFDGMLSIVVPRYGVEWSGLQTAGVHQFQDGRWTQCTQDSVHRGIEVVDHGRAP